MANESDDSIYQRNKAATGNGMVTPEEHTERQVRYTSGYGIAALVRKHERLRDACSAENDEICQILGKALGYPWFADDQFNFPGATKEDGVCVGDNVAASLAVQAANQIKTDKATIQRLNDALDACSRESKSEERTRKLKSCNSRLFLFRKRCEDLTGDLHILRRQLFIAKKAYEMECSISDSLREKLNAHEAPTRKCTSRYLRTLWAADSHDPEDDPVTALHDHVGQRLLFWYDGDIGSRSRMAEGTLLSVSLQGVELNVELGDQDELSQTEVVYQRLRGVYELQK